VGSDRLTKVLIIAHGHPAISPGGAEIAAYQMFEELNRREGWEAIFLARRAPDAGIPIELVAGDNEFTVAAASDQFRFHNGDHTLLHKALPEFLRWAKPDVVHFHHYVNVGIEMVRAVRNVLPEARLILTLHEYLAICNHNGQMVRNGDLALCRRSSPSACNSCFPGTSPEEFFLRERFLKQHFQLIDHFISPSQFLKQRYVQWGLEADKISVIENGQPPAEPLPPRTQAPGETTRGRFAFFGQINPYKGIEVLLDAMALLPPEMLAPNGPISLSIHGSGLHWQTAEFQASVSAKVEKLSQAVHLFGRYHTEDLPGLMAGIDWVVVPSIWWENAPLVIQEAQKFGRPLIVSGIGGMAEKVLNMQNGLHVRPRDPRGLADIMLHAATTPSLWANLQKQMIPPATILQTIDLTIPVYAI
jgi:glycosyltransferase involved in cell wall biosynthesis